MATVDVPSSRQTTPRFDALCAVALTLLCVVCAFGNLSRAAVPFVAAVALECTWRAVTGWRAGAHRTCRRNHPATRALGPADW